jgi:hypothetical protein
MPKRTPDAQDQISTARSMPANWSSGTGSGQGKNAAPNAEQNKDAERPAPAHDGAPAKLPGYGGGK